MTVYTAVLRFLMVHIGILCSWFVWEGVAWSLRFDVWKERLYYIRACGQWSLEKFFRFVRVARNGKEGVPVQYILP